MLLSVFVKMALAVMVLLPSFVPSVTDVLLPDGVHITVEVARSVSEQRRGLGDRDDIGDGMLFCYRDVHVRHFWMKDMRVPLDVVWLRDGRVTGMQEQIPALTERFEHTEEPFEPYTINEWTRFVSPEPSDAVLELPAGSVSERGIAAGDRVMTSACR